MPILIILGIALLALPAHAQTPDDSQLLRLETGMHMARINRIATDAQGRWLVTASDDKTARVWDLQDGRLLRVLRPPVEKGDEGKLYAAAMSPDGEIVAIGGKIGEKWKRSILLYQRADGSLRGHIGGLPNVVNHLAFSADGRQLAATLGAGNGLRVYQIPAADEDLEISEIFADKDYADDSYWVEFAADGRLLSTSWDGKLRLYQAGNFELINQKKLPKNIIPFSARINPDSSKFAVGLADIPRVAILDNQTMSPTIPDTAGIENGDLNKTAWSHDGTLLFAGGRYDDGSGISPVIRWDQAGSGSWQALPGFKMPVTGLQALPDGGLVVSAADPGWGVLDSQGDKRLWVENNIMDFRGHWSTFMLSKDGHTVIFDRGEHTPIRFSVPKASSSIAAPATDPSSAPSPPPLPAETAMDAVETLSPCEMKKMQQALAQHGLNPGPRDGMLGSKTRTALIAFQQSAKLPADGTTNKATLVALGLRAPAAEQGNGVEILSPCEVKNLQRALAQHGFNPGPQDGVIGRQTRAALIAFQQSKKLSADGKTRTATLVALDLRTASVMPAPAAPPPPPPPEAREPSEPAMPPRITGLKITAWKDSYSPKLNDQPLKLVAGEFSRRLAISPDRRRFVLGTGWSLRCYRQDGYEVWKVDVPASTRALNISGDGRLVVAAFADGIIRWYHIKDGRPLLFLFPHKDGSRQVFWTPRGYYTAPPGAESLVNWQINHGPEQAVEFYPAARFPKRRRPDIIQKVLMQD